MRCNPLLGVDSPRPDLFQSLGKHILCSCRFIIHLESNPEALRRSEKTGEPQPGVSRDAAGAGNDLADAALRYSDFLGQPVLGDAHGLQKLFKENLARVGVRNFTHIRSRLVIVHDLNVCRAFRCPAEAHAELVIDANAVQPG